MKNTNGLQNKVTIREQRSVIDLELPEDKLRKYQN